MENDMIEARVWQGLFEPRWGPNMNAHFFVPKMNRTYGFIFSTVSVNGHTLSEARLQSNVEVFSKAFAELPIWSLIIFHSGYNPKMLHESMLDIVASQTTQGMNRPTRLVREVVNLVSAFA
jgi:hypothetical protein